MIKGEIQKRRIDMKEKIFSIQIIIGGIVALMIVMGIGRFSFTPILPLMQEEGILTSKSAGYLASSNYLGYLLGALGASVAKWKKGKSFNLKLYLVINIATTLLMGVTESYFLWHILRFLSGLTSGFAFVLASSIVLEGLTRARNNSWSGYVYSGVGFGILLTGLFVPLLNPIFSWNGSWIGLGLLAAVLSLIPFFWLKELDAGTMTHQAIHPPVRQEKSALLPWLITSYGFEGAGYIISGTFLVALISQNEQLGVISSLSWVFVGAAAIPSSIIWAWLSKKWGNLSTLQWAFLVQLIGVILPVLLPNATGALLGALLFGITFMGIVTLTISEARAIAPQDSSRIIGFLTFVYGIGQMVAPAVAGVLIDLTGSYDSAFIFGSMILLCGLVFLHIGKTLSRKEEQNAVYKY